MVVNARVGRFALPSSTAMRPQSDEPRAGSRRFVVIASALLVYHYHDLSTRRFGPPLCATGRRPRAAAGNSPRPRHAALNRLGREPGKIRRHDIRQLQQEIVGANRILENTSKPHRGGALSSEIQQGWLVDQGPRLAGCGKSRDFGKTVMKRARNGNLGLIKSTGYEGAEGDELGWKHHRPTFSAAC